MSENLHQVQAIILKELLFKNGRSFSSLNKLGLTNDHFTFHIKHLSKKGIIEKRESLYFLTQAGKLYANKLDVDILKMEKFGTPSVAVTARKTINGKVHYLIQQRLKEPLYGYWGFINGKIRFSEFSSDTAKRELFEETGLTGDPEIKAVMHKMRGPSRYDVRLDHFFFLYLVSNPKGKIKNTREGKNYWKTVEEIKKLRTFPGFKYALDAITKEEFTPYSEYYVKVEEI